MLNKILKIFLTILGIIIFVLAFTVFLQYKKLEYYETFYSVDEQLQTEMEKLGLPILEKRVKKEGFPSRKVAEIKVRIPLDYPLDGLIDRMKERFANCGIQVLKLQEQNLKDVYQIKATLGFRKITTHHLNLFLKKAKVALLIDDFGYENKDALLRTFFRSWNIPFTISIIPGTPFAEEIAKQAHSAGKQVLVHMPMQPKGAFNNQYKWIILDGTPKEKIQEIVREAIKSIPYAEGLNNHMGSLVTTKENIMKPLLEILKEEGMFFVDSRTSSQSIAYSLAKKLGVKSTFNSVFLDNQKHETYIEKQFEKLILTAMKKGEALGLAHANLIVASTLMKLTKRCDNRKINFVFASEIAN